MAQKDGYEDRNLLKIKRMMWISGILALAGMVFLFIPFAPLRYLTHLIGILTAVIAAGKCVDEGMMGRMFAAGALGVVHFGFLSASGIRIDF